MFMNGIEEYFVHKNEEAWKMTFLYTENAFVSYETVWLEDKSIKRYFITKKWMY